MDLVQFTVKMPLASIISIFQITPLDHEVIVDEYCGVAVLRGANVFAPGILSISPGTAQGDQVSVYVDLDHKCLRGYAKMYTGNKARHTGIIKEGGDIGLFITLVPKVFLLLLISIAWFI